MPHAFIILVLLTIAPARADQAHCERIFTTSYDLQNECVGWERAAFNKLAGWLEPFGVPMPRDPTEWEFDQTPIDRAYLKDKPWAARCEAMEAAALTMASNAGSSGFCPSASALSKTILKRRFCWSENSLVINRPSLAVDFQWM